jgi:hypothetical protein
MENRNHWRNQWRQSLAIIALSGLAATAASAQEKKEIIIQETGSGKKETVIVLKKVEGAGVGTENGGKFDLIVPAPGHAVSTFFAGSPLPQGPGTSFSFSAISDAMPFESKVVKGAPYSADAVNEFTQTLPDGNRIQRKSESQLHRDGEGRTRREFSPLMVGMMPGLPTLGKSVQIVDPVAGTTMVLDPQTRTASKLPSIAKVLSNVRIEKIEKGDDNATVNTELKVIADVDGEKGTTRIITRRIEGSPLATGAAVVTEDVRGDVPRHFTFITKGEENSRTENLGRQTIEGIEAEGTRTVTTIPAGEVGNEKPIEIVSERWYSNALQIVLLTRHTDPRFGETVYRVTNINRAEPDAALFVVPADYKVTDGPAAWSPKTR